MSKSGLLKYWETDEQGRKYRMIGDIKEYAPELAFPTVKHTDTMRAVTPKEAVFCPLRKGICNKTCVLHGSEGCGMVTGSANATGLCPLANVPCNPNCIMKTNGKCKLIGRLKNEE